MSLSMPVQPFQMLVDPQAVLQAVAESVGLGALQRRVYRPLSADGGLDDAGFDDAGFDEAGAGMDEGYAFDAFDDRPMALDEHDGWVSDGAGEARLAP